MGEFIWRKKVLSAAIILAVGVVFGLVLGWWVWPVQWINVLPADLMPGEQQAYVLTVAQAYELNGDAALARQRLSSFDEGVAGTIISEAAVVLEREGKTIKAQPLRRLASDLALRPEPPVPKAPTLMEQLSGRWLTIVLPLVLVVPVLISVLMFLRRRRLTRPGAPVQPVPSPSTWRPTPTVQTFITSYNLGDDKYKQSFHIDGPLGELLGECGVKASVALGEGAPDRVAAFEVWLFCRRNIQTTTKVLVSPLAYQDDGLRSELVRKGDVTVAQPGSLLLLEAGELTMEARVLHCAYSQDETMGPESHFDHLIVQLTTMTKSQ